MKKILFWGTPKLTWTLLDSLKEAGLSPTLICTTINKPQGRRLVLTHPEIKTWADNNNIETIQPEKLDDALYEKLSQTSWDLFVVVAYGKIVPERFINLPKHGTVNVHYSLLPKYRGATPVESVILSGDEKTGVCVQKMAFKLDTGPILNQVEYLIPNNIKAPELREVLNNLAAPLLVETLQEIFNGTIHLKIQDDNQASYCTKIQKEDGLIDLLDNPILNDRKFRAFFGWPGVYFFEMNGNKKIRVKITEARLENGKFNILKVTPEGKKEMLYEDFLRGLRN